jgi:16S rRNA G966 N2-methylase RsmD
MNIKTKEKIFPKNNNVEKLQYDNEGLYSISHPEDANLISEFIINYVGHKNLSIIDATAGLGGNTISFSKHFKKVTAIELNEERFKMLENNICLYNLSNVNLHNGNCIDFLNNTYDVYFFDPPWGGPDYKSHSNLELNLGGMGLHNIIKLLDKNKIVVFKVPFNYNLNLLKDYDLVIKKIRNMLIILLTNI